MTALTTLASTTGALPGFVAQTSVNLPTLVRTTLFGLQLGMTLVLITVGLTLIFGMMDVINIAHGSLYMLGAYFGLTVVQVTGNFWVALLVAPLAVALVGLVIEVFTLRPLYDRNPLYHILLTFGIALLVQGFVERVWGAVPKNIATPAALQGTVDLLVVDYPKFRLFVTGVSTFLVVVIWVLFMRSDVGILMRASGHDAEMVDALGVDVSKVFTGVFVFGAWLAGVAGVMIGTQQVATPVMGTNIIIQAFAIVVIGGLGSFRGAVVGAIAVGMIISFASITPLSAVIELLVFVLMAAVLLVKPTGLFGEPEVS